MTTFWGRGRRPEGSKGLAGVVQSLSSAGSGYFADKEAEEEERLKMINNIRSMDIKPTSSKDEFESDLTSYLAGGEATEDVKIAKLAYEKKFPGEALEDPAPGILKRVMRGIVDTRYSDAENARWTKDLELTKFEETKDQNKRVIKKMDQSLTLQNRAYENQVQRNKESADHEIEMRRHANKQSETAYEEQMLNLELHALEETNKLKAGKLLDRQEKEMEKREQMLDSSIAVGNNWDIYSTVRNKEGVVNEYLEGHVEGADKIASNFLRGMDRDRNEDITVREMQFSLKNNTFDWVQMDNDLRLEIQSTDADYKTSVEELGALMRKTGNENRTVEQVYRGASDSDKKIIDRKRALELYHNKLLETRTVLTNLYSRFSGVNIQTSNNPNTDRGVAKSAATRYKSDNPDATASSIFGHVATAEPNALLRILKDELLLDLRNPNTQFNIMNPQIWDEDQGKTVPNPNHPTKFILQQCAFRFMNQDHLKAFLEFGQQNVTSILGAIDEVEILTTMQNLVKRLTGGDIVDIQKQEASVKQHYKGIYDTKKEELEKEMDALREDLNREKDPTATPRLDISMEERKKLAEIKAREGKPLDHLPWLGPDSKFPLQWRKEYTETDKADWIKWWNKQGGDPDKAEEAWENRINTLRETIPVPGRR